MVRADGRSVTIDASRSRRQPRWAIPALVLLVAVVATVWIASRSSGADAEPCTLSTEANVDDEVGAASPEEARIRWAAANGDLGIDAANPVMRGGREGLVLADYRQDAAHRREAPAGREVFLTITTQQGGDGVWRVIRVTHCEQTAA